MDELLHNLPADDDEWTAILAELVHKSDRSTVILGVEFLHHHLAQLIRQFCVNRELCDRHLLDDGNPLSGFLTRAHIAYVFGLVSHNEYHDLLLIGEIKTRFANDMESLDFEDPLISGLIRSLRIPRMVMHNDQEVSVRQKFEFTVAILAQHLKWRATEGELERRTPPEELLLVDLDD